MQKFTPLDYIKISVANAYGLDKSLWQERIDWFDANLGNISKYITEAEEPILMQKGINAYYDALQGNPTGYLMSLDATASGIQIMACLIGCNKTAEAVNLVNTGERKDVYTSVADVMGHSRSDVKKPVMTHFYGSKNQPKEVFGDLVDKFYQAMERALPGAVEVMQDMQSCWQPYKLSHSWVLPDNHHVDIKVMAPVEKRIEIDEMDHATFTHRTYQNIGQKTGISLAANIVHSIDGYVVREMYRRAQRQGFDLLTIHDSFWAHPNNIQKVRQNYVEVLADIADSTLLQDIFRQITGNVNLVFHKYNNNLAFDILRSEYALS